eukprot:3184675-Amphidinium_carterae.1
MSDRLAERDRPTLIAEAFYGRIKIFMLHPQQREPKLERPAVPPFLFLVLSGVCLVKDARGELQSTSRGEHHVVSSATPVAASRSWCEGWDTESEQNNNALKSDSLVQTLLSHDTIHNCLLLTRDVCVCFLLRCRRVTAYLWRGPAACNKSAGMRSH